jgi:hypothetical protein
MSRDHGNCGEDGSPSIEVRSSSSTSRGIEK